MQPIYKVLLWSAIKSVMEPSDGYHIDTDLIVCARLCTCDLDGWIWSSYVVIIPTNVK